MAQLLRSGLAAAAVFGFCAGALAQSDDCANPTPISGFSSFPFDLTTATTGTQGQNQAFCNFFAGSGVERDVWFCWTAAEAGQVTVSTCGETSADTKIIVYDGCSCPAVDGSTPDVTCNDDACGLQTEVTFDAVAGGQYLIQLGTSALQGSTAAQGNLVISNPVTGGGNDDCAMANVISGEGQFAFDTTTATTGFDGQDFSNCSISGLINNDQWFCWTPPQDGFYTISTCGSTFDTKLAIYEDFVCECPFGPPSACNDDGCGEQSTVTIGATMFSVYMIQVGNAVEGVGGAGTLDIALAEGAGADECSGAEEISGAGTFAFDTTLATTSFDGQNCDSGTINNDLWYAWTAPNTAEYHVETCGLAGFDTELAVYQGPDCPGVCIDGNDDACGLQSMVQFNATQGQVYLIQVGSFSAAVTGPGAFTITEFLPPPNDECDAPTIITGTGSFPFDNTSAATGPSGQGFAECDFFGNTDIADDVWFLWTAPSSSMYRVETCGTTTVDTDMAVYAGASCPPTTLLGCNDDGCPTGLQSRVDFAAVSGQQYLIQVGAFADGDGGVGDFTISQLVSPPNDTCAAAVAISEGSFISGTLDGAADEGVVTACLASSPDVWYRITPSLPNTDYRAVLSNQVDGANVSIFSGCPAGGGAEVACSANERVVFNSGAGGEFWIRVANEPNGVSGPFDLVVEVVPPGDECGSAIPVTGLENVLGTTVGFAPDVAPFCGTGDGTMGGVWYSFVGYGSQTMITTCMPGTDYDTKLRVYTGTCGALECVGGNDDGSPGGGFDTACDSTGIGANRASTVRWFAESGVTYFILVHGFSGTEGNYELAFDLGLPVGACCVDDSCTLTVEPDCNARGGLYRGDGTSCTEFTYGIDGSGPAFEDISANPGATELALTNNSGQTVPIGFTFDFYGAPQTMVGVSDNGYLSFGGPLNVSANGTIPSATGPNGVIAPFWDDLHPAPAGTGCSGMEGIHYQTLGAAPNRRFIVQWTSIPQFDFFGRCLDSNTFQVVLFESGAVDFRYGTITAETAAGDYTVGIENADGSAGTSVDGASLTSNSSIHFGNLSPDTICSGGPVACVCERDGTAGVNVFDLLAYLDLWFVNDPGADVDGTPGVNVFDLLSFLDCWFPASAGAPCP